MKVATRDDVARLAGVSSATVSRVINNSGPVKDVLRKKVEKAIKELNYKPNQAAKSLRARKNYVIAYVVPDIVNPFYTEIYKGINLKAEEKGYHCHLIEFKGSNFSLDYLNLDGIITSVNLSNENISNSDVPIIFEGIENERGIACYVHQMDEAYTTIFEQIRKKGKKQVGAIIEEAFLEKRLKTIKKYCDRYEIDLPKKNIYLYQNSGYQYNKGYDIMSNFLENNQKPDVLFTQNDLVAIGAMKAIYEAGYKIPEDISIIGCDDTVPAQYSYPPLTTIKRFKKQMGEHMCETLIKHIDGEEIEKRDYISSAVLRGSL